MKKHPSHTLFYMLEIVIIVGTFAMILTMGFSIWTELIFLIGMLTSYTILGILHHRVHHDIKGKVVLEYILVSILILTLYLFLNITRI